MITRARFVITAITILITNLFARPADAALNFVVNTNADPNIFECSLTATQLNVTILTTNGALIVTNSNVHAEVYKDENAGGWPAGSGIPIPVMILHTGQMVICHFKNTIPPSLCACEDEGASIHWHGTELDNDSDGTGITQDSVLQDQTYTYKFIAPRPGIFWFHSHMMPGDTTFAGMYGAIIIPNDSEPTLITGGVLPAAASTYTLALSDIEFLNGNVGRTTNGLASGFATVNQWAVDCHTAPNSAVCQAASKPGVVTLVNGQHPQATPGAESPLFTVKSNQTIRLRLLNEALTRHFRLKLLDAGGNQINLYRVGGQGGLLNNMRLEGGIVTQITGVVTNIWNSHYGKGEIVIGSGDRVDVVASVTGTNGALLRLVGNPLPDPPFKLDGPTLGCTNYVGGLPVCPNIPSNYPVAFFRINGTASDTAPTDGAAVLAGGPEPVPQLGPATGSLLDPAMLGLLGTNADVIGLTQTGSSAPPAIDGVDGSTLDGNLGNGAFLKVPHLASTRYARVGDLLQLSVKNATTPPHPFHLHGFSMQPLMITDNDGNLLRTYEYNEFVDTIDVYGGETLVFRVLLEDRPKFCDESPNRPPNPGPVLGPCTDAPCGGALGRWAFHCHIFAHAGDGMLSELTVLEPPTNLVKWVQNPDVFNGMDVRATLNTPSPVVADDFMCTNSGPITGISIWGSWLGNFVDSNVTFELKFWTDDPSPPSHPSSNLWREVFPPGSYASSISGAGSETFYGPGTGILGGDNVVFRYDFIIPQCEAFYQYYGNIYWLSVSAQTTNGLFGWKTCITNDAFGDDAAWSPSTNYPTSWTKLDYPSGPYAGQSMDMAFQLITTVPSNCLPPVASFTGCQTGQQPLPVAFTDTSTGSITNWYWDFGDGSTTNLASPGASHTYTNAGTYTVTLVVSDSCGDGTNIQSGCVTATNCAPPSVNFAGAPTNGPPSLMVGFTGFPPGTITNWFWDFGDGNTTNVVTAGISHTYTNPGSYTVTLIASDSCGDGTNTKPNYITVLTTFQRWVAHYFPGGGPNSLPDADPDSDGMSNTNEFLTGFNPNINTAYLRIISIIRTNINDIKVTYLGANGDLTWIPGIASRTNVLEFTKGAGPKGSYTNNFVSTGRTNILSGGNGLGVVTNMVETGGATNGPSRYYRIRVLLP